MEAARRGGGLGVDGDGDGVACDVAWMEAGLVANHGPDGRLALVASSSDGGGVAVAW